MGLRGFIWYSTVAKFFKRGVTKALPADSVWEKEWDVLVILDACRSDLFNETIEPADTIQSVGSTSSTWIERTFEKDVSDIGYITGNGHIDKMPTDDFAFFHLEPTKQTEYSVETVPPTPITDHAVHAWRNKERYGMDKLIVHYMQPHAPFRSRPEWFTSDKRDGGYSAFIWKRLKQGEFTQHEVWEAYKDNLKWVWEDAVSVLAENMEAKIAVSADHGNGFGELGFYGHPCGCPANVVREVPWHEIEGKDSKRYKPSIDELNQSIDQKEHLSALGYI